MDQLDSSNFILKNNIVHSIYRYAGGGWCDFSQIEIDIQFSRCRFDGAPIAGFIIINDLEVHFFWCFDNRIVHFTNWNSTI